MSFHTLKYLRDLELLKNDWSVPNLDSVPEDELREKLDYYREYRERKIKYDIDELKLRENDIALLPSSISASNAAYHIIPLTLYAKRIFVNDPLFEFAFKASAMSDTFASATGMKRNNLIDRTMMQNKLLYFSYLRPLIETGIIATLPISHQHEPKEHIPVYFSPDNFKSNFPSHVYNYIHREAVINQVQVAGESLVIMDTKCLNPCTSIEVGFKNDSRLGGMLHFLANVNEAKEIDSDDIYSYMKISQSFDKTPPAENKFRTWVEHSINRSAIRRLIAIEKEISLARLLNARYMTESKFEAKLLSKNLQVSEVDEKPTSIINFIKTSLPQFPPISPDQLAILRCKHEDSFTRFRVALEEAAEDARQLTPKDNLDRECQRIFRNRIHKPAKELASEIRKAWRELAYSGMITTGTILMAISSNPLPLCLLLGSGAYTVGEALKNIDKLWSFNKNPLFFYARLNNT